MPKDIKETTMKLSRRDALWAGFGGIASATLANPLFAATVDELTAGFTGGATAGAGGITLTAPEIAENGNTVPISVEAPGAVAIMLLAAGNPEPAVATFTFGPAAGRQMAATRIRLAKTQDVIALAKMADGSIIQAAATVKVTIGGCGG
jgi:sulfur-oxidizing protein SoxY